MPKIRAILSWLKTVTILELDHNIKTWQWFNFMLYHKLFVLVAMLSNIFMFVILCNQIFLCFLEINKYLNTINTVKQNPHRWCKRFGHIKKHPNIWKLKRFDIFKLSGILSGLQNNQSQSIMCIKMYRLKC